MPQPIIVIGMHRSGTSMISRMLEDLGLFMGMVKDPNNEAEFFLEINSWLMRECCASWDRPEPVDRLMANRPLRGMIADYLRYYMGTRAVVPYLGLARHLSHRTPEGLEGAWGWKDPRNTYTLPLWLDIFPEARIVHVVRHGVDVAKSMHVRMEREVAESMATLADKTTRKYRGTYYRHVAPSLFSFELALQEPELERCFALWENYVERACASVAAAGDRAIEFHYEDFLANTEEHLQRLAEFCGLPCDARRIAEVAGSGQRDRAFAYRGKPELSAFAAGVADRLARFGYTP